MPYAVRYRALGALVILGAALWSGYAIFADAPVVDEAPHLAAGISYVQLQDYRLNPEHPPLIKLAAGAFAQIARPHLPTDAVWWPGGINEQWRAGDAVLWDGRTDAGAVLALGRLGVTLLNLLVLVIGWRLVAWRWNERWALGFLVLCAASPFFLGHAHLVTTDIAAAGLGVLAIAAFAAFLENMTWRTGAVAAAAFGVAQLAKFSMILLVPAFLLVALLMAYQAHGWKIRKLLARLVLPLAVCLAGYAFVVYPVYLALTWNGSVQDSARDTSFLLSSFAGGPSEKLLRSPARYVADATVVLAGHKITQPISTYLLGVLMVAQRSAGGNTAYFLGDVGSSGSKLYFPVVYAAKETLPALAVTLGGLGFLLWHERKRWRQTGRHASFELVAGVFVLLYVGSTLRSSLNIGIRHLFPVIPLLYLLALSGWRTELRLHKPLRYVLGTLVGLQVAAGLLALPYPLAAYNALAGGTAYGYRVAADSNYDWGQDELRLRAWIDAHPEAGPVAVNLFGASDEQALLGPRAIAWWSARGNPTEYNIHWIAISSSYLLTATQHLVPREPRLTIDEYRWLDALKGLPNGTIPPPDARAGTGIFLYHLE